VAVVGTRKASVGGINRAGRMARLLVGIAQGTVVIEASNTSGAKMQARIALEHGKKVFLIRNLTEHQEWARTYVEKHGAIRVDDVTEVVAALAPPERIHAADQRREQLVMDFG
jgi:DNA processing protein